MLTDYEFIVRLWDLGHFHNPNIPTDVAKRKELEFLKVTDSPVQAAIRSYQKWMAGPFNYHAARHHKRAGEPDGIIGPATRDTVDPELTPRCGHPDHGPGAEAATGSGSWPAGCHSDWPNNHTFTVNMDKSNMPSFLGRKDDPDSILEQAWRLCQLSYADMGQVLIREDGNTNANTTTKFRRGNGWIGLATVPQRFSCGMTGLFADFDTRYSPAELLWQWARLLAHEYGHNQGWGHTPGGILNSYIEKGIFTPTAWRGDPNEDRMIAAFGGVPVDLGGGPDEPKPEPSGLYFPEPVIAMLDGKEVDVFNLVRAARG